MDIKEHFKNIMNGKNVDEVVEDINRQQEDLNKISHLFKSISLAKKIEKFLEDGRFKDDNIKYLDFEYVTIGYKGNEINFWLVNEEESFIVNGLRHLVRAAFSCIEGFEDKYVNENFIHQEYRLEVKPGIGEQLLNLFLSYELKKIYEYNKMELDLPTNTNNIKKLKM